MLTILYNLFAILVVLVSILLSVGLLAVIERKLVGSMQQRIQPNTAEHYAQLQPFTVRIMVVVLILTFTTLAPRVRAPSIMYGLILSTVKRLKP